jgi:hypothetical protein
MLLCLLACLAVLQTATEGPALPDYEQLNEKAAAAQRGGEGEAAVPLLRLRRSEQAHFDALMRNFQLAGAVKDQSLALYVNSKVGGQRGMLTLGKSSPVQGAALVLRRLTHTAPPPTAAAAVPFCPVLCLCFAAVP